MATNVLQKNQSYPALGYRIDGKGIAYDLETGKSLSREEVDARIGAAEDIDPTTDDYAARTKHRGGVAGSWDRNKQWALPAAEFAMNFIPGVGPLASAALGAAAKGLDRPGQGGIGFDPMSALKGGVQGYSMGKLGDFASGAVGNALSTGARVAEGNGLGAGIREGAKALVPGGVKGMVASGVKSLAGGGGVGGLTTADLLKMAGGAVESGLNYQQNAAELARRKAEFDRTQGVAEGKAAVGAQDRLNLAPVADRSQYMLSARMAAPPTAFKPRDITQAGGAANLETPATGGAAAQLAANQAASASYKPGAGGVDTSTLELLLNKLKGSAFGSAQPAGRA